MRIMRYFRMVDYQCPWLVVNSASGSYSEEAIASICSELSRDLDTEVKTLDCTACNLPHAEELDRAGVQRLAIFAGDGTISNYLSRLEREGWQGAVLPLPGGTKNLLCSAMFGAIKAPDLATMYRRGELCQTWRDCMRCEHLTALVEILVGPGARWSDVREEVRSNQIREAFITSLDITKEAAKGELVFLAQPNADAKRGYPGLHFSLSGGTIEARGYRLDTPNDWIEQGWAMLAKNFREGPFDELGRMQRACCELTGGHDSSKSMALMVDGERESASDRIEIRRDTFGIRFLGLDERQVQA